MELDRGGRELVSWPIEEWPADLDPDLPFELTFDGATWYPTERAVDEGEDVLQALVAGPDATGNPAGTIVLALGAGGVRREHRATFRADDHTEVIIRNGGYITIY